MAYVVIDLKYQRQCVVFEVLAMNHSCAQTKTQIRGKEIAIVSQAQKRTICIIITGTIMALLVVLLFLSIVSTNAGKLRRTKEIPCIKTIHDLQTVIGDLAIHTIDEIPFCQGGSAFRVALGGSVVECGEGICHFTVNRAQDEEAKEKLLEMRRLVEENSEMEVDDDDEEAGNSATVTGGQSSSTSNQSNQSNLSSNVRVGLFIMSGIVAFGVVLLVAIMACRRQRNKLSLHPKGDATEETSRESNESPVEDVAAVPREDPSVSVTTWTIGEQSELTMEGFSVAGATIPSTAGPGFSVGHDDELTLHTSPENEPETIIDTNLVTREVFVPPGRLGIQIQDTDKGPIVLTVREDSPIAGIVFNGDKILCVNEQNGTSARNIHRLLHEGEHTQRKLRLLNQMESFVE